MNEVFNNTKRAPKCAKEPSSDARDTGPARYIYGAGLFLAAVAAVAAVAKSNDTNKVKE